MPMHAAKPENSPRLRRLLAALADGREHTSRELQDAAQTVAVGTCASELRAAGHEVVCRRRGRVWTYRLAGRTRRAWRRPRLRTWPEGGEPPAVAAALNDRGRAALEMRIAANAAASAIGARPPYRRLERKMEDRVAALFRAAMRASA